MLLYVDDAGVASRSTDGLARMMTALVDMLRAYGLTGPEKKIGTLLIRLPENIDKYIGTSAGNTITSAASASIQHRDTKNIEHRYPSRCRCFHQRSRISSLSRPPPPPRGPSLSISPSLLRLRPPPTPAFPTGAPCLAPHDVSCFVSVYCEYANVRPT